MTYKQVKKYGFRDGLSEGDPEKVIYGQDFDGEFEAIEKAFEAIDPDTDGSVDINEIDGLQDALDNKADKDHTHDEYLTDAPNDGKQYVRESEAWAEVTIPEAGISEPTSDGKPYSRQVEGGQTVGAWVEAPTTDDIEYLDGRIDAIEGNISGGGGFVEAPDDGDDYARNGQSPAWVKTYNAEYIDALEADYKNADSGKADKVHNHAISDVTGLQTALDGKADTGHDHDGDYSPLGHTHTTDEITGLDDKISEIESDITDLEGAVGELTGQLALGGSYDASTGLVVTANLSSFTAGQPLPDYSTVSNTFVIVTVAGNNPEELGEGDWLVAGQSGWVAIKYGTAGSVDWDNISNVPDFDLVYAPIDHTHEIADVDGLQDALDSAGGPPSWGDVTGKPTEFPPESHQHEIADVDGLQDALDAAGESLWTQNGDDIYYNDGKVGIAESAPDFPLHITSDNSAGPTSQILIQNKGGSVGATVEMRLCPNVYTDTRYAAIRGINEAAGNATGLSFLTNGVSSSPVERVRIDAEGNVGIGAPSSDPAIRLNIEHDSGVYSRWTRTTNATTEQPIGTLQFNQSAGSNPGVSSLIQAIDENGSNAGALTFYTGSTPSQVKERVRIDAEGRVGIGGEPGTRAIDEAKALAKTKLTEWKAEVKKRTAEQPEASTQEITLEVTDGDFGVMPTEEALAEFLQGRGIGGGDNDLLQVNGYGYFAGGVVTNSGEVFRRGNSGLFFNDNYWVPLDNTAAWSDGEVDLGTSGSRFKDAHFSGDVNASEFVSARWRSGISGRAGLIFTSLKGIAPTDPAGNPEDGTVDLGQGGDTPYRFKDGHFSGTIYGTVADVPAHVKVITPTQIANWDAGTGGGGGATTDGRISDTQITNWDSAYSWGNHASAGYQPAGNYQPAGDYLTPASLNGYATESWVNGQGFAKGSFVPTSGNSTISGTLTATDFVASSDERLKDDISPMPVGLIDDIKPVQWTWKDSGKKSAGVIAQQLQEIGLDDFVTEGEDGMLGVNYNALVSVLLAEVISLKKELAK